MGIKKLGKVGFFEAHQKVEKKASPGLKKEKASNYAGECGSPVGQSPERKDWPWDLKVRKKGVLEAGGGKKKKRGNKMVPLMLRKGGEKWIEPQE